MQLALGKVDWCPCEEDSVAQLRADIINALLPFGLRLKSSPDDRREVLLDYRLMELCLAAARDPEVHLGSFAVGVRGRGLECPGSRRCTSRRGSGDSRNKRRWRNMMRRILARLLGEAITLQFQPLRNR